MKTWKKAVFKKKPQVSSLMFFSFKWTFHFLFTITESTIGTPVRNNRYQSRSSDIFYLTANDINSYKSGMLDRNVTCSVTASTNLSTIGVWIMDLRFRPHSPQKVIIYNGLLETQLGGSNHTRPFLQPISSSSSINVTFETVRSSDEFLWLGFVGQYLSMLIWAAIIFNNMTSYLILKLFCVHLLHEVMYWNYIQNKFWTPCGSPI